MSALHSTTRLRRLVDAIPEMDRADFVPAIHAMQRELSPEIVRALLDVVDAACSASMPSRPNEAQMRSLRTALDDLENIAGIAR